MNRWSTTAWIFLAVEYASQKTPAKLDAIIGTADAINHAIPTQKELRRCLGRLQSRDLIRKDGKAYSVTHAGRGLADRSRNNTKTVFEVLSALTLDLPDGGDDPKDDDITEDAVREGFESYKKTFNRLLGKIQNEED
ncbi:hypothetical protein [Luteolibacter sp. AS25]|uniref:hypothetical protein n=1 Tax=Luteolibacter sp. AS25 TaxID=3135776 RepID=UPI00398AA5F4